MMDNRTNWFPPWMKPVYIGVYEVCSTEIPSVYAYWAGEGWLPNYISVATAYNNRNVDPLAGYQHKVWRGLVRPIE